MRRWIDLREQRHAMRLANLQSEISGDACMTNSAPPSIADPTIADPAIADPAIAEDDTWEEMAAFELNNSQL